MLQITEESLEKAMAGLIGLDWGPPVRGLTPPVEGVATATLHLLRERTRRREEETLQLLEGQQRFCDAADDEVVDVRAGVPLDLPPKPLAKPPAGAIPASCPRRNQGTQTDGPVPPEPPHATAPPRPSCDVGVQVGPTPLPDKPSWADVEAELREARAADVAARQRRVKAFAALEEYLEGRAVPPPRCRPVAANGRGQGGRGGALGHLEGGKTGTPLPTGRGGARQGPGRARPGRGPKETAGGGGDPPGSPRPRGGGP